MAKKVKVELTTESGAGQKFKFSLGDMDIGHWKDGIGTEEEMVQSALEFAKEFCGEDGPIEVNKKKNWLILGHARDDVTPAERRSWSGTNFIKKDGRYIIGSFTLVE